MTATVLEKAIYEGGDVALMARIVNLSDTAIVQADVASIEFDIWKVGNPQVSVDSGTLTISAVIFDTLQNNSQWTRDSTGYNFRWDAAGSRFPDPGTKYGVSVKIVLGNGQTLFVRYELTTTRTAAG